MIQKIIDLLNDECKLLKKLANMNKYLYHKHNDKYFSGLSFAYEDCLIDLVKITEEINKLYDNEINELAEYSIEKEGDLF